MWLVRVVSVGSLVHLEAEKSVQVEAEPIYCIPCDECGENCYEESWCIEQLDLVTTTSCVTTTGCSALYNYTARPGHHH